jgi:hypothetical protein
MKMNERKKQVNRKIVEEVCQSIRARKDARSKRPCNRNGHAIKIGKMLLPEMLALPRRDYTNGELEVFVELAGGKYTSIGPTMTILVREGYVTRVSRGVYRATGKVIPEAADKVVQLLVDASRIEPKAEH